MQSLEVRQVKIFGYVGPSAPEGLIQAPLHVSVQPGLSQYAAAQYNMTHPMM